MMRVFTRALGVALGLCLAAAGDVAQTVPAKPTKLCCKRSTRP